MGNKCSIKDRYEGMVDYKDEALQDSPPSNYDDECFSTDDDDCTSSLTVISFGGLEDSESDSVEFCSHIFSLRSPEYAVSDNEEINNCTRGSHRRVFSNLSEGRKKKADGSTHVLPRNGGTVSGTPLIRSFRCLLPECVQDYSENDSWCEALELEESFGECTLDFTSSLKIKFPQEPRQKSSVKRLSTPGSEMRQCSQIMVTGGPLAGFYDMKDRVQGRPSWGSSKAEIHWSIEAKAWLLRPVGTRRSVCLAMLRDDTINPCFTLELWRTGLNHGTTSIHQTFSFKSDQSMVCTPSSGSGIFDIPSEKAIEENTVVRVRRGLGVARFIGPLEDQVGTFVGVELFTPTGLNNGTRKGFFYFEAKPRYGVFVRCPVGVTEQFGQVSDQGATMIDNLLTSGKKVRRLSRVVENRVIKIVLATCESRSLFCTSSMKILEIILFYELSMLC